jgi:phosphatidate phosphatase APP1
VISDLDDTIKITEVRDRHAAMRNTFLREFQPVPGMAEFYQTLARSNGAIFHYISASPWQLYEPLAAFVRTNGFPAGTFALKPFRWKDKSFFDLFANPERYKSGVIVPLLQQFPKRKFILIGDSGERDPEIYAALARKYPKQIVRIYIRDVTDESADKERYVKAFRDVPPGRWQIFRDPNELKVASE